MKGSSVVRFILMLAALLIALVAVQIGGLVVQRSADRAAGSRALVAQYVEQIRRYDDVLTMSARLAASTGDVSYVDRYHEAATLLDRAIVQALLLVTDPVADEAVSATDRANRALVALEEASFRRLAAGDSRGAYALVSSPEYGTLKDEYRAGMDIAVARLEVASAQQRARATHRQRLGLTASVAAVALLALLSAATARGLHRSQRARGRVEDELRTQAESDPLTGLANRRLFRQHLTSALAAADTGRTAVLVADLDHFKTVNDTRGHAHGDALLVEVAQRLTRLLRNVTGALAARLGGDEFAILLTDTDQDGAKRLAEQLVLALGQPYAAAPSTRVTASVGLAVATSGELGCGALLRGADLAMYDAKTRGRAQWSRYADHMHGDLLARVELEIELREGIHRGELVVYYQPISHLRTGQQHGVEALVRWQHPERGLLPPGEFVALAERADLITGLGRFVLEQACRQLATWRDEIGDDTPSEVAVNVSSQELHEHGYASQVLAVLHLCGLEPSSLVLELTESTVMTDQSRVIEVLVELRAAGIRIAIDDFGTGHSSLARLHELPVDIIKIDRSFVHAAAPDDPTLGDTTMLEMIVGLAQRLRLESIAEGIETSRQLEMVRDVGCTYGQGYLLGRPQPAGSLLRIGAPSPAP